MQETLRAALKEKKWLPVASKLAAGTKSYHSINLSEIDAHTKAGDTLVVIGKILSSGTLSKKVRIAALSFSAAAKEKMKETKSEAVSILDEMKQNPKAEGLKML